MKILSLPALVALCLLCITSIAPACAPCVAPVRVGYARQRVVVPVRAVYASPLIAPVQAVATDSCGYAGVVGATAIVRPYAAPVLGVGYSGFHSAVAVRQRFAVVPLVVRRVPVIVRRAAVIVPIHRGR